MAPHRDSETKTEERKASASKTGIKPHCASNVHGNLYVNKVIFYKGLCSLITQL